MTVPMALLDHPRFAPLLAAAGPSAQQQVLFDRDETDSYRIRLEGDGLTRPQLMAALPVGSRWLDAGGWDSWVVVPGRELGTDRAVVLVALEAVIPHGTRGAHPVFGGVLVPEAETPRVLEQLAESIDPGGVPVVEPTHGVIAWPSRDAAAHRGPAAWMLRSAATAYARGQPLLVRTALLTEDQVPRARTLLTPRSILLGTAAPLRARFSWRADVVLRGLEEP